MKKLLLAGITAAALFFSQSAQTVQAQSFATDHDTVSAFVSGANFDLHNNITNQSVDSIEIEWRVTAHDFPISWRADSVLGICDNFICRSNIGDGLVNGTLYTSGKYAPAVTGDFHLQLTNFSTSAVVNGSHYITVNLKVKGGVVQKNITFIVSKFPTGVSNVPSSNYNITLYPNPARNDLNVQYDANARVKNIAVYNLIGKAVSVFRVSSPTSAKLDISNIPAGIYFLRVTDVDGRLIATRKFTHQ